MTRFVRLLALVGSLTLVLPHGWCCLLAAAASARPAADPGCCPKHRPAPAEKPAPVKKDCPCSERHATAADSKDAPLGPAALAPLPAPVPVPAVAPARGAIDDRASPEPARPLHVLNCVWLC